MRMRKTGTLMGITMIPDPEIKEDYNIIMFEIENIGTAANPPLDRHEQNQGQRQQHQRRHRRGLDPVAAHLMVEEQWQGLGVGCAEQGDDAQIADREGRAYRQRQRRRPPKQWPVDQAEAVPASHAAQRC